MLNIPPISHYYGGLFAVAIALISISPLVSYWLIPLALVIVVLAFLSHREESRKERQHELAKLERKRPLVVTQSQEQETLEEKLKKSVERGLTKGVERNIGRAVDSLFRSR